MRAASPTRQNSALLVVLLTVQLILMAGSARRSDGSTLLESLVLRATSPVVWVARGIGGGFRGAVRVARETWVARAENDLLRREVLDLRARLARAEDRQFEARRLVDLLGMREDLAPESVAARVIARGDTRQARVLTLDRGSDDGVRLDAPVVAWGGAVGRVVYVDARLSKVLLVSDPNSSIAGILQRTRGEGMVQGNGDRPLSMRYVSRYQDVAIGDRVVTSGVDGVFPRGFSLGRVTYVDDSDQVSMTILMQPAVEIEGLEEVLVLTGEAVGRALDLPAAGSEPAR